MKLSGWGRYPILDVDMTPARHESDIIAAIGNGTIIARGNGRAYGDSALGSRNTLDMRRFNRMLAFNAESGQLVAEAGVILADIIATFLPRGWFPSVTPGTRFVTLGGMLAADVHGKNHHIDGGMVNFVDWIDLACADGIIRRCSPTENADLFSWTVGGMGLTGVILRAAIRLRPVETGWVRQQTIACRNLEEAMAVFEGSLTATYSVAWIDCYATGARRGRSIVMLGEHGVFDDLPDTNRHDRYALARRTTRSLPIDLPGFALNKWTVSLFNQLYYAKNAIAPRESWVGWERYFYPLDAILNWNRIYGRKGFAQFQCALPQESSRAGLERLLDAIASAGAGSFLAVLKRFGAEASGLSFPMPGYTLALDFPISRRTLALLDRLDGITLDHGGRFYLAKDSRMRADTLTRADGRVEAFRRMRDEARCSEHFQSAQSKRLSL